MWLIIFGVSILLGVFGIVYLAGKVEKTGIFNNIESRVLAKLAAYAVVAAVVALLVLLLDTTNAIIIVIHVAAFLLIGDLTGLIIRRSAGADVSQRIIDLIAVLACFVYFAVGWYLMHGLWETDYLVATDKQVGKIKIAHIADSHIGTGFSGRGFAEKLARIQEAQPDILVITGDFVDDSTMKQDMLDACEALSEFDAKYGVYYVLGNHDFGYYSNGRRGYSGDELLDELRKSGVNVLLDETADIDGRICIVGRKDAGYGGSDRKSIADLMETIPDHLFTVVLDHQPTDYEAEAAANADLVLSGHTHGGQLWPLEYIQPLISENDNVRGEVKIGNTTFIVTDGISDWAIRFRTGCKSEYNIITVEEERK